MVSTNAVTRRPFFVAALTLTDTQTRSSFALGRNRARIYSDETVPGFIQMRWMGAEKTANMVRKSPLSSVTSGLELHGFPTDLQRNDGHTTWLVPANSLLRSRSERNDNSSPARLSCSFSPRS